MSPRDNQSTSHLLFEVLEPRLLLATVPLFGQTDPAWANDPMVDSSSGLTVGTIQQYGCAMTCTAMLAKYYGVETDPKQLNAWLNTHQGYVNGANLVWAKPAEYTGGLMTYEDSFRWSSPYPYNDNDHWSDLKAQLDQGYPVIVEVDAYPSTPALDQHWVLVTGFLGGSTTSPSSYAINDPRDGTTATLDRYYDGPYDNTFFGIRVYHGVASANLPAPVLIGPGTGSFPGQTLSTTTPTFQWQSVSGADQYGVYIREMNADGSAGALVFNSVDLGISIAGSATSYILPGGYLQNGRRYRWNMSAHNSAGWSPNYAIPLYFNVSLGGPVITDRQKQDDLLQIVNTHRGTLPSELVLAAIRQEGGEGAFHVDGWAYNSFYLQDDGAWAQPTNGDGVMQVTEESWHHEVSGPYSHDEIGYDYAIDDGCDYLLENFSSYGSLVQAALHYNTGPNSLYIYLGRNWGDRSYLSNMAGHLDAFVPNYYGLVNPLLGTILRQGQTVLDDYLYGKGILAGQAVSYYAPYQAQLDGDLYAIEAGDTIRPTVDNFLVTPDSVVAGNSFTISYTVSDTGGSGLKQVELWRTSDPTGTSGWNEVVSVRRSLSGSGNGPVPGTFSDGSALPPGTYLYGIHVVDNAGYYSTEQDAGWSPKMVTVAPPLADLRGNTFDSQEPLIAGQTFNVIFSLDNNGSTGAGGFWVDFYLSSNSTITTSDKYLGDYYVSGLPPGSCTLPLTATLTLPARNDAFWSNDGTYYVGMIVDSTGAIPESDETNNQNRGDGYDRDPVQIAGTGNQAPVVNGQTLGPVAENSANGTVVGSVAASDPDTGQSLTYAITGGNTGNAFAINATTGQITVATSAALNYETTPSFALTVQVTDNGTPALSDTGTVTINLTNVNEMPTGVSLSSTTVAENQPAGTAVGTLSTVDPDVGNTFTYSLVTGTGSTDNASFTISGSTLRTAAAFNYETKASYSVRLRTTDQGGLWYEEPFTIAVTNVNDAPILDTGIPPALTPILAGVTNPAGDTVPAIIGASITDPDGPAALKGIAVTAVDNSHGTWQYSSNNSPWYAFGSPSVSWARQLAANANTRIRFVPNTGFVGTATIQYRAWDQTTGSAGDGANTSTNGGTSTFSTAIVTGTVTVNTPPSENWVGTLNNHWENAGNWSAGIVPGADTAAIFDAPATYGPVLYQDQNVKGIDIRSAGWTINVGGNTLRVGDGGLAIAGGSLPTSRVNLDDGNLIIDYAAGATNPAAQVRDWVKAGYNAPAGDWNGNGITSGVAKADAKLLTAVGVIDNTDPLVGGRTVFEGQAVDASSVLVKYTYWGDANFDGRVTFDDYDIIDYYYWFPLPAGQMGWWTGDFDMDGNVDFDDYDKIDYAYWFQGAPLGGLDASVEPVMARLDGELPPPAANVAVTDDADEMLALDAALVSAALPAAGPVGRVSAPVLAAWDIWPEDGPAAGVLALASPLSLGAAAHSARPLAAPNLTPPGPMPDILAGLATPVLVAL